MCFAPDADFFNAIKSGKADVVTDQIDSFTDTGLRLRSGRELPADIVVTATGLNLQMLGGIEVAIDGRPLDLAKMMNFKGVMFSDVPNLAVAFGYTNASWTLKCDLTAAHVARLIAYMDRHGYATCTPRQRDASVKPEPLIDLTSGYFQRALEQMPRQGSKRPWRLYQNYLRDLLSLRFGSVNDAALEFSPRRRGARAA
jgi:cation diffusion facilitator CzcD-associated flavoprotein CzcO